MIMKDHLYHINIIMHYWGHTFLSKTFSKINVTDLEAWFCVYFAAGHCHIAGAYSWKLGQYNHCEHPAGHCTPAPSLHDGPQWQQHQTRHAAYRCSGALPWPELPPEKIHSLHPRLHWLCLPRTAVSNGKRDFPSFLIFSLNLNVISVEECGSNLYFFVYYSINNQKSHRFLCKLLWIFGTISRSKVH